MAVGAVGVLLFLSPLAAQMGELLIGVADEAAASDEPDETVIPGWEDLNEGTWGPAARVDEYLPHEACDSCFTLPNYSPYTINEYVESDVEEGVLIILREIPNPNAFPGRA